MSSGRPNLLPRHNAHFMASHLPLPNKQYDVVLIDPPWPYSGQQDKWGAAAKFYDLMTEEEILAMPVTSVMKERSVLFLWATSPKLDLAMRAIQQWGLCYRGVAFVWVKTTREGVPFKARGTRPSIVKPTCEFVLACSMVQTGRPLPLDDESIVNTVLAPLREHSRKPDEVRERIERMYIGAERLEMFAREKSPGWDVWGAEAPNV